MTFLKPVLVVISLMAGLMAHAQYYKWNNLAIELPQGWSSKANNGIITYSNYNLRPAQLQSFNLYPPQKYLGKPDTLFALAWQQLIAASDTSIMIPRWRRFNTLDGILLLQGSLQTGTGEGATFRQLNIFVLENSFQACVLETTDSKSYKLIQNEWQERLLGVRKMDEKKR